MAEFIFDVDGTLTPSREKMDLDFRAWFNSFCLFENVYIVTGSDRSKTIEQISEGSYNLCKRVYNCSGNDVWERGNLIRRSEWELPDEVWKHLETQLNASKWGRLTGHHFDIRPGLLNFSVLGRNASTAQRKEYFEWDAGERQRESIAFTLNYYFGEKYNIEAVVAGETGIDIFQKGSDKSQVLKDFDSKDVTFFGDRTYKGGNDYSLARLLPTKQVHQVKDWRETWEILKTLTLGSQQ